MTQLSPQEMQTLERLFDQQMWALGRDATRPGDNLLIRRGFTRAAPPPGAATSGTYRLVDGDLELELSSLGIRVTVGTDSVYLDRDPMARVLRGANPLALALLMRWLASYESWVNEAVDASWREWTLRQRSRPPSLPAHEMAAGWTRLAVTIESSRHSQASE
jgi:hypothetical protein